VVLVDHNGRETIIDNVLYVTSGLKTNILSLRQLLQKGFVMEIKEEGLSIYDKNQNWLFMQNFLKAGHSKLV